MFLLVLYVTSFPLKDVTAFPKGLPTNCFLLRHVMKLLLQASLFGIEKHALDCAHVCTYTCVHVLLNVDKSQ